MPLTRRIIPEEETKEQGKLKFVDPILIEIDRQIDKAFLKELKKKILDLFDDIKYAVNDWPKMQQQAEDLIQEFEDLSATSSSEDLHETLAFQRTNHLCE